MCGDEKTCCLNTGPDSPKRTIALTQFDGLGLAMPLLKSIEKQGFTSPTPIQQQTIPALLQGRDLMGIAHTGGGKTAAFALPLLHKLFEAPSKPGANRAKALILAPTRELAQQIGQCIFEFSKGTKLTHLVVAGGLPYGPQIQKLRRGVDVLIATPGRLMDHVQQKNVSFDDTATFILDEADRMLDMGFIRDVQGISEALPDDHQTVLFSATMNAKISKLASELLRNPVRVEIEQESTVAETIDHKMMTVKQADKRDLLLKLLRSEGTDKTLVFTRTKRGADRLAKILEREQISCDAIHGDKRQRVREKILKSFRGGRINVLIATDLAARGIDVDGVTHVINFDLPMEAENYVHRVGRTGRAGNLGKAISFCDPADVELLRDIERTIGLAIEVEEDQPYHIEVQKLSLDSRSRKAGPQRKRRNGGKRSGPPRSKNQSSGNGYSKDGAHQQKRRKAAGAGGNQEKSDAVAKGNGARFKKRPASSSSEGRGGNAPRRRNRDRRAA